MSGSKTDPGIPAGSLVVVARGHRAEQLALTYTSCYGPGRWPFVRRWMGERWTVRPAKARVLRLATDEDRDRFGLPLNAVPHVQCDAAQAASRRPRGESGRPGSRPNRE
jgi:hypothetical protein